jgi:hypothetical protein
VECCWMEGVELRMLVISGNEGLWGQLVMEGLFDGMFRASMEFSVDRQLVILMFLRIPSVSLANSLLRCHL